MSTRRRSSAKTSLGSQDADLASIYVKEKDRLAALGSEVKFTLERSLIESGIKIHDVEFRVKELESITKKIADKQLEQNLFSISDLVGARVVCLFRSDMDRAAQIYRTVLR